MSWLEVEGMDGRGEVERILRNMLQELFEADSKGARRDRLARAHGYADGYMRALVDLKLTTEKELLQLVLEERRKTAQKPQPRLRPEPARAVPSLGYSVGV